MTTIIISLSLLPSLHSYLFSFLLLFFPLFSWYLPFCLSRYTGIKMMRECIILSRWAVSLHLTLYLLMWTTVIIFVLLFFLTLFFPYFSSFLPFSLLISVVLSIKVYWYKNDERMDYSFMTDGVSAFNTLPLEVDYSDNNAIYKCVATSVVLPQPMSTQIQLTVNCKHYINKQWWCWWWFLLLLFVYCAFPRAAHSVLIQQEESYKNETENLQNPKNLDYKKK